MIKTKSYIIEKTQGITRTSGRALGFLYAPSAPHVSPLPAGGAIFQRGSSQMTRRDYVLIAGIIEHSFNPSTREGKEAQLVTAHAFAVGLAKTNELFDRERFLKACGVQVEVA